MSHSTNFSTLMIILMLYVEPYILILETLEKLGFINAICRSIYFNIRNIGKIRIYYRILLVLILLMQLLVVDLIIVNPYCITFLRIKQYFSTLMIILLHIISYWKHWKNSEFVIV